MYGNIYSCRGYAEAAICSFRGIGDHSPRHVHVYRDNRLVVKWDLDGRLPMQGKATARVRRLLEDLVKEGKL
jgi:hypothetical protein